MKRWLRQTLPPDRYVASFFLLFLALEGIYHFDPLFFGAPPAAQMHLVRDLLLVGTAVAYGVFRVMWFHPLFNTEYRQWLERTPWTIAHSLPVGPVHLMPQDILVLLSLYLLGLYEPYLNPARLPLCFLLAYLAQLAISFAPLGLKSYTYVMAVALGVVVRFWFNWPVATIIAACLYPLALGGLRHSLLRFPWDLPWFFDSKLLTEKLQKSMQKGFQSEQVEKLGWPYGRLSPQTSELSIGLLDGTFISLIAGGWLYVCVAVIIDAGANAIFADMVGMCAAGFCLWLAIIRLGIYCSVYHPPINLAGRVLTLRWIIPGYDKVLIAPALTVTLPWILLGMLKLWSPLPPAVNAALPFTAGLFVALNFGPSLIAWHLTGNHRLVAGFRKQTSLFQSSGQRADDMIEI